MSVTRRPQLDGRRRMVIYSQRFADEEGNSSVRASVEAIAREARRPVAAYGWRVQRRLRSRWYGVVPVRRRAMCGVALVLLVMMSVLALGHWAALWWEPIATRPDVARALRLDRPDSFGTWLGSVVLMLASGASFLVYQLRRYRTDDYHGHYRLWRIAILVTLAASVDSVTNAVATLGGLVDVVLAERDVLAGADWVRLLVGVSGAAFGLRMVGELSRNRWAAAILIGAFAMLAVSPAVRWNLIRMEPVTAVMWTPIARLTGRAMLLLSVVVYLRSLYREVRKIEASESLADRLRKFIPQWHREPRPVAAAPPPKVRKSRRSEKVATDETPQKQPAAVAPPASDEAATDPTPTERKRWWSRRAATTAEQESPSQPKQSRFGLGRRKTAPEPDSPVKQQPATTADKDSSPRRSRGWFAFGRRQAGADEEATESGQAAAKPATAGPAARTAPVAAAPKPSPKPAAAAASRTSAPDDEEDGNGEEMLDEGNVDWEGLSKAERRRMRKLIKRQDRAA